jgi:hypothetical protein
MATVRGGLRLTFVNGYEPVLGQWQNLMTFDPQGSQVQFGSISMTGLGLDRYLETATDAGTYRMRLLAGVPQGIFSGDFGDFQPGQNVGDALPGFGIDAAATGGVVLVLDPDDPTHTVLRIHDSDPAGQPVLIYRPMTLAESITVEFTYRFLTDGKLQLIVGGIVIDTLPAPADTPGVDDPGRDSFASFSRSYDLDSLGLTGNETFALRFTNAGDPEILLGDLKVLTTPEPATLSLLAFGGAALVARRKKN